MERCNWDICDSIKLTKLTGSVTLKDGTSSIFRIINPTHTGGLAMEFVLIPRDEE